MALFKKKKPAQVFPLEADGTMRANGNGKGMFRIQIPAGWNYPGGAISRTETSSRLFLGRGQINDGQDATISIRMGDAGTRPGEGLQAFLDSYSKQRTAVDFFNYDEMPDPMVLADVTANSIGNGLRAQNLRLAFQLGTPDPTPRLQEVFERFTPRANAMRAQITEPFLGRVLRTYEFERDGAPWRMAIYVQLEAVKDTRGLYEAPRPEMLLGTGTNVQLPEGVTLAVGQSLADLTVQQRVEAIRSMQATISGGNAWCYPEFAGYVAQGTIYWCVESIVTFVAPTARFDAFYPNFMPFVDALSVHEDVEGLNLHVLTEETKKLHNVVPF